MQCLSRTCTLELLSTEDQNTDAEGVVKVNCHESIGLFVFELSAVSVRDRRLRNAQKVEGGSQNRLIHFGEPNLPSEHSSKSTTVTRTSPDEARTKPEYNESTSSTRASSVTALKLSNLLLKRKFKLESAGALV